MQLVQLNFGNYRARMQRMEKRRRLLLLMLLLLLLLLFFKLVNRLLTSTGGFKSSLNDGACVKVWIQGVDADDHGLQGRNFGGDELERKY